MTAIATLATGSALEDLRLLLASLALWNKQPPPVYLYCDATVKAAIPSFQYSGPLFLNEQLNSYSGKSRAEAERLAGTRFKTMWMDFMTEKIRLLEWIFEENEPVATRDGVLFCDADICFTAPLPSFTTTNSVVLSRHEIRGADEAKYGRYNGGFLWIRDPRFLAVWTVACESARFYEQSALEVVAETAAADGLLGLFPRSQNYGWWRLFQGEVAAEQLAKEWSIHRKKAAEASGILIGEEPLGSVHTHFGEARDRVTVAFNSFVIGFLQKLKASHPPAKGLLTLLEARTKARAEPKN